MPRVLSQKQLANLAKGRAALAAKRAAMGGSVKKWEQGAVKHKGAERLRAAHHGVTVHQQLVTDAHSKNPTLRKRGILGLTFEAQAKAHKAGIKHYHGKKQKGGQIEEALELLKPLQDVVGSFVSPETESFFQHYLHGTGRSQRMFKHGIRLRHAIKGGDVGQDIKDFFQGFAYGFSHPGDALKAIGKAIGIGGGQTHAVYGDTKEAQHFNNLVNQIYADKNQMITGLGHSDGYSGNKNTGTLTYPSEQQLVLEGTKSLKTHKHFKKNLAKEYQAAAFPPDEDAVNGFMAYPAEQQLVYEGQPVNKKRNYKTKLAHEVANDLPEPVNVAGAGRRRGRPRKYMKGTGVETY